METLKNMVADDWFVGLVGGGAFIYWAVSSCGYAAGFVILVWGVVSFALAIHDWPAILRLTPKIWAVLAALSFLTICGKPVILRDPAMKGFIETPSVTGIFTGTIGFFILLCLGVAFFFSWVLSQSNDSN